jgi:hypothetical protein
MMKNKLNIFNYINFIIKNYYINFTIEISTMGQILN